MEFHEKLQELRKQKNLTQEELAQALFVSRTAISKWESGRGYPNIDSLKAIAKFFSVTVDALLSGQELLSIAEEDTAQKEKHIHNLVFGLLDCSAVMFFFLPFFGQKAGGAVQGVSLAALTGIATYLKIGYWSVVMGLILSGVLILALQNWQGANWLRKLSLALNAAGVVLFVAGLQPYGATLLFVFLMIKVFLLVKRL